MSASKTAGVGLKIVAHLRDGKLIKGFADASLAAPAEAASNSHDLPPTLLLRSPDQRQHQVDLASLKALFFVKSFEGRHDYSEVKFFSSQPQMQGIWVRIVFQDGEVCEGVVYNSLGFLIHPGFFLKPPDPHSNNEMVWVAKASLTEFRVLGIRNSY